MKQRGPDRVFMCDVLNEVDFAELEDARFPSKKRVRREGE